MLSSLSIRDFVIVEALDLEFPDGFTALTGETGAGKSILLDALGLALGDRADPDVVRAGADRAEIQAVADGRSTRDDNPLCHAPHHHSLLIEDIWTRSYSKAEAFFPMAEQHEDKYWPPVARIDNVFGDKHVVCSCPPIEAFASA